MINIRKIIDHCILNYSPGDMVDIEDIINELRHLSDNREIRWCENGCGYKLPEEYAEDETICGACLNELEDTKRRIKAKQRKMRGK